MPHSYALYTTFQEHGLTLNMHSIKVLSDHHMHVYPLSPGLRSTVMSTNTIWTTDFFLFFTAPHSREQPEIHLYLDQVDYSIASVRQTETHDAASPDITCSEDGALTHKHVAVAL